MLAIHDGVSTDRSSNDSRTSYDVPFSANTAPMAPALVPSGSHGTSGS